MALFALAIGSLLNVIIYRLPLMLQAEYRNMCNSLSDLSDAPSPTINLFFPRSFCPKCHHKIRAFENIPLFSYLFLMGRCGQCKQAISWRYPCIELLYMILSLYSLYTFGFNQIFLFTLVFFALLIPMCFIDLDHQLLPDSLTQGLLWIGLIANTQSLFTTLPDAVLSAAGAYLSLWLFIKLFYLITGKIGMGHGDFKLFAAFGAWFGWSQLPLILLMSSLIGALIGIVYLKVSGKSHATPIPFGPFLCFAGIISLFFGPSIISWYVTLI